MSRVLRYDPDLARLAEQRRVAEVRAAVRPTAGSGRRRAKAGRWWEDRLERVHDVYLRRDQAVIAYAPARVTPIRRESRIVAVKMEKGKVDYVGRAYGRPIAFDCKGCQEASWRLEEDAVHQLAFLRDFARDPNALAFFLLCDAEREELLIVPQQHVRVGERVKLRDRGRPRFPIVPRRGPSDLEYDYLPTALELFCGAVAVTPGDSEVTPGNSEVTAR